MPRPVEVGKGSRVLVIAAGCVVIAALYFAQDVLVPLALSFLFCFLLAPLVTRLQRLGVKRIPAVIIVVLAASGIVVALGWATTVQIYNLADRLPDYRGEIVDKIQGIRRVVRSEGGIVERVKEAAESIERATTQPATTQPASQPSTQPASDVTQAIAGATRQIAEDPVDALKGEPEALVIAAPVSPGAIQENPLWVAVVEPSGPIGQVGDYAGRILRPLGTAGLVVVFVIFMLISREDLRDRLIRLVGKGQLNVTTSALDDAASRISKYMLAQAIVNGTYGIAVSIALLTIGQLVGGKPFPSFLLWGLLCAVLRFIPYIGPWIAAAFPLALSIAVYHGFGVFFCVVSMFIIIELLSNNFMEPWLYGSSTGMSTVAVLVSAVFWTWLWGPIGLILATPMTVCLVVLGKYVPQMQFLDIMLGDEPVLEPPDRIYQRLLALDQEEAAELAHAHLTETSLESVYDDVLLPAMAMAETDRHRGKLGEERERFIMQTLREMVEELGDAARLIREKKAGADTVEYAKGNGDAPNGKSVSAPVKTIAILPKGCTVNVVCLPARDEGDDIVNNMLTQLLALRGYCAFAVPVAALASEMVEAVEKKKADVVIVSALPPGAVSYSRYLCKRVHARYPEAPMAVGLWTIRGDLKKAKERITCAASVQIATTLSGMVDIVHQLAQPVIAKQPPAENEPARA